MPFDQRQHLPAQGVVPPRQAVVHPHPLAAVLHQSGMAQGGEVAGDGGLGEIEDAHQVADAQLPFLEKGEEAQAGLLGEGLEEAGCRFHGILYIRMYGWSQEGKRDQALRASPR